MSSGQMTSGFGVGLAVGLGVGAGEGVGLPLQPAFCGPVTDQQHRVKLQVSRTILQVRMSVGAVVEGVTVVGVGEEPVAGRTVEARRRSASRRWLWW